MTKIWHIYWRFFVSPRYSSKQQTSNLFTRFKKSKFSILFLLSPLTFQFNKESILRNTLFIYKEKDISSTCTSSGQNIILNNN